MWTTLVCSRKIENKKSNRQPGFRGPLSVAGDGIRHIYLNLFYIIQIYMSSGLVLYTLFTGRVFDANIWREGSVFI